MYWTNIPNIEQPENKGIVLRDILEKDSVKMKEFQLSIKHHNGFLRSYKWRHCNIDEKSNTLLASYYKQPPHSPYVISSNSESNFRRLTPLACAWWSGQVPSKCCNISIITIVLIHL